jgi:hypothetical protein
MVARAHTRDSTARSRGWRSKVRGVNRSREEEAGCTGLVDALGRTSSETGELTRDEVLDNITLYWLTNTGVSASRLYCEYKGGFSTSRASPSPWQSASSRASSTGSAELDGGGVPHLIHFNELDRGGHFAAWEQPQLFAEELRAGLRSLR